MRSTISSSIQPLIVDNNVIAIVDNNPINLNKIFGRDVTEDEIYVKTFSEGYSYKLYFSKTEEELIKE